MAATDYDDFLSFLAKPDTSASPAAPESPTTAPATASDDSSYSDDSSDGGFDAFKMFLKGPSAGPVKIFSSGTEEGGRFEGVETETAASTAVSSVGRDGPTDELSSSSDLSEPNFFDDTVEGVETEVAIRSSYLPANFTFAPGGPAPKEERKPAVEPNETVPEVKKLAREPEAAAPDVKTSMAKALGKEIEKPAADHKPSMEPWVSPLASGPGRRKPMPKPEPALKPAFKLPEDAPAATVHFAEEKAKEIEAARDKSRAKDPVEPLPFDYFTKQGEAMMEAKAKAARELAEAEMPLGVAYFTAKAKEESATRLEELEALSEEQMAEATRYFKRISTEEKGRGQTGGEAEVLPAAIQHFTLIDRVAKEEKRKTIEDMKKNPPPMPDGQAYFTNRWLSERERVKAENEEMRKNPPPASVATEYFKIREEERKVEIEKMMNEPAPAAIEFFTQQARMMEERNRRAYEAPGYEPPVATKYFAAKEIEKAAAVEAARDRSRDKEPIEPLPIDYFTKQGEAMMEDKTKSARDLAEAEMPIGVAYFTAMARDEKVKRFAEHETLRDQHMPVATRYFWRLSEEEEGKSKAGGEAEIMPAAIQHFTLMYHAEKEKKLKEIETMKENPPPLPDGQAYFTNRWLLETARQKAENEEMRENPPPASVATEYFKIKHEERKVEIEKMMNEPAPAAIEFFTQQARQEQEESRRVLDAANEGPYEPPAATKHFAELEDKKAQEIKDARDQAWLKMQQPSDRPAVDWAALTKQTPPVVHPY